ncbi:ribonuclease [Actinomyces sp. Chiba101]|uniref:ribonuclease HII n=1 Tax=Actinomyces TaxID=1654 RepID=UPI000974E505|nr:MULTISPECIES: ribonuclease HII [Actinomyces]BAW92786.1 ribonuclease [Actinomyces sp. Chiba101]GAV94246.1 ribonuclease [Actinomyces denticolens]SUU07066.1 Ribonuclease HII [Actinomyces denticolens]
MPRIRPDRALEASLLEGHGLVGGLDEVGRGALAGPVTVGLAVVSRSTADAFPEGLADSKALSAARRQALVAPVAEWLADHAIAHASAAEIDALGIAAALRLAGRRALAKVRERGNLPGIIILDGAANWLSPPADDLFAALDRPEALSSAHEYGPAIPDDDVPGVIMRVRADASCAVVAAASVLAKVERDAIMSALPDPGYGWASNKGYGSAAHQAGLAELGACEQHRRSWRLPGLG